MLKKIENHLGISFLLGIIVAMTLSFQYTLPELNAENTIIGGLKILQQVFNGYGLEWTLIAFLIMGFIYATLQHIGKNNDRAVILLILFSFIFGVVNVCGLMMYYLDDLPFFENICWRFVTAFLVFGWAILFYCIAHWILYGFERIYMDESHKDAKFFTKKYINTLFHTHTWLVSFCFILLCWLPWIIVYYPASMDWDVYRQLCSALSIGWFARSNHDPWLASNVLAFFYKIGTIIGNENIGIFLFVLCRDVLIAAIYANCIKLIYKAGVRRMLCILVLLFYAVTPVWGAYAKHAFKDTLAAALFCAYITSLVQVIIQTRKKSLGWKECVQYCICATAAALFRNNPIYAILPATVILVLFLLCQRISWKKCTVLCLCVVVFWGFNFYIFNFGDVSKGSSREAMSLMFQQTARTVKYHDDEITPEEKEMIDAYLDYDSMAELYDPVLSDPIKDRCKETQNGEHASKNYLITWAKMFFKYPDTYIESAIAGSYGYYAFTPKLPEGAGNWNSGMTIFDWIRVDYFIEEYGFDFYYNSSMQVMREILHNWSKVWNKIPILSLTDTIATYTWLIVLLGYEFLRKKKWPELIPIVALLIMVLTCIASPVNDSFRYYSPIAASIPVLLVLIEERHLN